MGQEGAIDERTRAWKGTKVGGSGNKSIIALLFLSSKAGGKRGRDGVIPYTCRCLSLAKSILDFLTFIRLSG